MIKTQCKIMFMVLVVAGLFLISATPARADAKDATDAQAVVENADATLGNFIADPDMDWFRSHVKEAQGVFIVPSLLKAGFIFGGSGGTGVLLGRSEKDGTWSPPAFFTMGSASFGFAAGVENAEVVLMIMTPKGMDAMLSSSFKLGADTSVALGPVGAGAKAQTADVLAFSRAKGIYGGMSVEGSVIKTRDALNSGYYGKEVRTVDIVVQRSVGNPHAAGLIQKLTGVAK